MFKRFTSSVTAKLLLTFLALMAAFFAVFGYGVALHEVDKLEIAESASQGRRAAARSDAVKYFIVGMRDRVELASRYGDVRRAMSLVKSAEDARELQATRPRAVVKPSGARGYSFSSVVEELDELKAYATRDSIMRISLVKVGGPLDGTLVYDTPIGDRPPREHGHSFVKEPWYRAHPASAYVSTFFPGDGDQRIFFVSPVHSIDAGADTAVVGLLVFEVSSAVLLGNLLYEGQSPRANQIHSAFIADVDGTVFHELVRTGPRVFPDDCSAVDPAAPSDVEKLACWRKHPANVTERAPCIAELVRASDGLANIKDLAHDERGWARCSVAAPSKKGWTFDGQTVLLGLDAIDSWNNAGEKEAKPKDLFPHLFVAAIELRDVWRAEEMRKQLRASLGVNAAALLATCCIMALVLSRMTRAVREVLAGTRAIAGGDLATRIPVQTTDEIGQLATGFNEMAVNLEAAIDKVDVARRTAEDARANAEREHLAAEDARLVAETARAAADTARIAAEEARELAREASEAKSTFLATMSHELRTPLNAIIGYSEMLAEDAEDEGVRQDLEKIRSAGKHLLALIGDLLDISKIEAGKMTLFYENTDVRSLVDDIASTVTPLVAKNSNALVVVCDEVLGSCRADVMKLRQSLFNLLSNATKFTSKGTITLTVKRIGGAAADARLRFDVSDTGIGITDAQMDRLFKPFSQADESTTRKYGGTGLGLALTKSFIELMGGRIEANSVPGSGTTFTIEIPVAPTEIPKEESTRQLPSAPSLSVAGRDVLVIDDDPAARELMQRSLTRAGFGVRIASNGADGLAEARASVPDAILLDVSMPDMDGWTVLGALKADPLLRDVPVVMTSMLDERDRGAALGAAEYVNKPINWDYFNGVLGKLCAAGAEGHVLVVDDDPASREMARRMLQRSGYEVREAENGRVALEMIEQERPSLILLDLMMPELSGFDVIARLSKDPQLRTIPVVVITAKELTEQDRARLTAGVQHVYQKGALDRDELVAQIRGLVSSRDTSDA